MLVCIQLEKKNQTTLYVQIEISTSGQKRWALNINKLIS